MFCELAPVFHDATGTTGGTALDASAYAGGRAAVEGGHGQVSTARNDLASGR